MAASCTTFSQASSRAPRRQLYPFQAQVPRMQAYSTHTTTLAIILTASSDWADLMAVKAQTTTAANMMSWCRYTIAMARASATACMMTVASTVYWDGSFQPMSVSTTAVLTILATETHARWMEMAISPHQYLALQLGKALVIHGCSSWYITINVKTISAIMARQSLSILKANGTLHRPPATMLADHARTNVGLRGCAFFPKHWYPTKKPCARKMMPQIEKAQPAGVMRVGYAALTVALSSPLILCVPQ
mmetsp:Transcript_31309/g.56267  ORF Transcript_31309/g.56267 Transcript_31309/m.56267 type:complete len:248 (-) Transcript_31309:404-1147(-)